MISARDLRTADLSVKDANALLNEAADTIEAYQHENKELYHKLEVLAAKIEEYRSEEDAIKTALVTAQKMADKIKKDSSEAAALLIESSEAEAKEKMDSANLEAEAIVKKARDYSANLINNKTNEANEIITTAQNKANDAISSSKIVAKDILDQAKAISDDLISKSKAEKEAYEILISTIKNDAKAFVESLKKLYGEQLDILNSSRLDTTSSENEAATKNVEDVHSDISNLIDEVDELSSAIPEEITIPEIPHKEFDDSDVKVEVPVFEHKDEPQEDDTEFDFEEIEEIDDVDDADEDTDGFTELTEEPAQAPVIIDEDEELPDPMEAVEAFSQNQITPIDSGVSIPEINDEPEMDDQESLFDDDDQLPFESYFNVKREDVHNDKSQTISLIPPEDDEDEEPKFKGFFKKKK